MYKKIIFFSVLTLACLNAFSQIPIGTWRDHFSYKKVLKIADAGDKVYAASEVALFLYDKTEGSVEKLTKIQGLSDAQIQTIAYNKEYDVLIIAYKNSNIDIIKNNTVYNLSDIKRKNISTDKTIYDINFKDNTAYISCGFGIVLLDIENVEFKDTFFIGTNASYVKVNNITFDENNIYAATDNGLYFADMSSQNLADYRNWNLVAEIPDNDFKYNLVKFFNGYLFANQIDPNTGNDTLYFKDGLVWNLFNNDMDNLISISVKENNIVFTSRKELKIYNKSLNLTRTFDTYDFSGYKPALYMAYATLDDDNNLLIADYSFGLVYENKNKLSYVYPNGPFNNYTARALSLNQTLITTDGNIKDAGWYLPVYNIFENNEWKSYHISQDTARNFFSIAVNPKNKNDIFFGSWGYGIFEFENNELKTAYNNLNSTLQPVPSFGYGYIRIYDTDFDKNNNLWVTNPGASKPISVKTENGQWKSFNLGGVIAGYKPEDILVAEDNIKWIELGQAKGLLAFDDNGTPLDKDDDRYKVLFPTTSEGTRISTSVTALLQDKNGYLWLGTDSGVAIYYNPENVFEDNFYADKVQLTSYGKDTTQQYLLETETITTMKIDGGNRKWIATKNSGVFLISKNGKEEILHFDKFNSPLVSNTVNDLAIMPQTGEVFFLTDLGIMSYRGEATEADEFFGNVYVFPNPVRPGYEGKITITGLASDVNVKITDVSGNVVYETDAFGGQAIWDGKTFDGRKVNTGVYLVFCSNKDGSQTYVTKLLFVN